MKEKAQILFTLLIIGSCCCYVIKMSYVNRQKYNIPSKFQTYIHYEKPIIFFGDKLLCDFINDNSNKTNL